MNHVLSVFFSVVALAAAGAQRAEAQVTVSWGTPVDAKGLFSSGSQLTAGFTFGLGTFDPGFTPTLSNAANWADSFNLLDTAAWAVNGLYGTARDSVNISSYTTPVAVGQPVFIWGFNSATPGAGTEWILFSNPSWNTPAVALAPPYLFYTDAPGTTAVTGVGQMLTGAGTFPGDFQTSAIPEPATYAVFVGVAALAVVGFRRFRRS